MYEKHLSSQVDSELNRVSSNVLELGGLVEMQIRQAIYALSEFSIEVAEQVEKDEQRVNALEQLVIPGINYEIRHIQTVLEQRALEEVTVLKRIKAKLDLRDKEGSGAA